MTLRDRSFQARLGEVQRIAREVAAKHAADVDARSRFPAETLSALREAKLLSAPVPRELGGDGCDIRALAEICATLARACGSSGMVLAMHYVQVACLVRHAGADAFFSAYLAELVREQRLVGSMTSENGTFGEMRASLCAVQRGEGRFTLQKDATTGSYAAQADAILVTARRGPDVPETDQVLVLLRRGDYRLTATGSWDAMGMRGTCSPGFQLDSSGAEAQILPCPFADIAAQTMVPYSHVLWASVWWGIAADALAHAAQLVRDLAKRSPGHLPANAVSLAAACAESQTLRHNWMSLAAELDALAAEGAAGRRALGSIGWALKLNHLKVAAADAAPRIVHQALQITGILGYKNDTAYSVTRHYRDVLSASLMISNGRILSKSASMLLIYQEP
jgi:acyl-CoA dehydrogenase